MIEILYTNMRILKEFDFYMAYVYVSFMTHCPQHVKKYDN